MRRHYTPIRTYVHTALFITAKLEAAKMSFSRWMDKWTVVHPDNEIVFGAKKKSAIKPWKYMEEGEGRQFEKAAY